MPTGRFGDEPATIPGIRQGVFSGVLWVQGRDARGGGGGLGGLREILVALKAHRNPDLWVRLGRIGWSGRPDDSQDAASAANRHAFAQRDLRRHAEREFDFGAFGQRSVGEEEDPAGTEVLGESDAFQGGPGLPKRERKKVREALSDTAFNPNWRSGHGGLTSLPNRRDRRNYFSSRRAIREAPSSVRRKHCQAVYRLALSGTRGAQVDTCSGLGAVEKPGGPRAGDHRDDGTVAI